MDAEVVRQGGEEVEVSEVVTGTGARLRIRALPDGGDVVLDPLELEGLTRLPFTAFPPFAGDPDGAVEEVRTLEPAPGLHVLRNEFAMVGVSVAEEPDGARLLVRNMASGAEVRLRPAQLATIARLRHRDLSPLVDPSGLAAAVEPDPDQV